MSSIRAACPFCGMALIGRVEKVKNDYKLDNGDPDYRERILCVGCKKYVFTLHSGIKLAYDDYVPQPHGLTIQHKGSPK